MTGADPRVSKDFVVRSVYLSDPLYGNGTVNRRLSLDKLRSGPLRVRFQAYREADSPYDDQWTPGTIKSSVVPSRGPSEWYRRWVLLLPIRDGSSDAGGEPTPAPTPPRTRPRRRPRRRPTGAITTRRRRRTRPVRPTRIGDARPDAQGHARPDARGHARSDAGADRDSRTHARPHRRADAGPNARRGSVAGRLTPHLAAIRD